MMTFPVLVVEQVNARPEIPVEQRCEQAMKKLSKEYIRSEHSQRVRFDIVHLVQWIETVTYDVTEPEAVEFCSKVERFDNVENASTMNKQRK